MYNVKKKKKIFLKRSLICISHLRTFTSYVRISHSVEKSRIYPLEKYFVKPTCIRCTYRFVSKIQSISRNFSSKVGGMGVKFEIFHTVWYQVRCKSYLGFTRVVCHSKNKWVVLLKYTKLIMFSRNFFKWENFSFFHTVLFLTLCSILHIWPPFLYVKPLIFPFSHAPLLPYLSNDL